MTISTTAADSQARQRRELQATALFIGSGLIAAITIGSMRVSGWSGGVLDNRIEPVFWAGAILAGVAVTLFGIALIPRKTVDDVAAARVIGRLTGVGVMLFLLGPVLCIVAVFADYWI